MVAVGCGVAEAAIVGVSVGSGVCDGSGDGVTVFVRVALGIGDGVTVTVWVAVLVAGTRVVGRGVCVASTFVGDIGAVPVLVGLVLALLVARVAATVGVTEGAIAGCRCKKNSTPTITAITTAPMM